MTALARAAILLSFLTCWCGGSRRVALALLVVVAASTVSTLPLPPGVAPAVYIVVPATSAWLALHVAFSAELVPSTLGFTWVLWVGFVAPPPANAAWWTSIVCQLGAVAALDRPLDREARCVAVLLAGDVAAALLSSFGAPYWPTQGQAVLVAAALIWIHRDVFACATR